MAKHTLSWTFEELGRCGNKSLEVEFECHASPGSPGSYWDPPDPPEVEFANVSILDFYTVDGDEIAVGSSWLEFLKKIAFAMAEKDRASLEESIFEDLASAEEAALDDYWDRKRDEQRGC